MRAPVLVDARGLSCPLPVLHTRRALQGAPAALEVRVTSGMARANVVSYLRDEGYAVSVLDEQDGWRIAATRRG